MGRVYLEKEGDDRHRECQRSQKGVDLRLTLFSSTLRYDMKENIG